MNRILHEVQNKEKALELRLEGDRDKTYYVILAGITLNLRPIHLDGPDDYCQIENETYHCKTFWDYWEALKVYDEYKLVYIDGVCV